MPNPRADNVRRHLAKLRYFGKADGMPSVQVHRIAYAADKLWMATPAGLAVSDGKFIRVYTRHDGLQAHGLRNVTESGDSLLVGSDTGLDIISKNQWSIQHSINLANHGDGVVEAAYLQDDGKCWLGTASGLRRYDLAQDRFDQVAEEVSHVRAVQIIAKYDNLFVVTGQGSLWRHRAGEWQELSDVYMDSIGPLRQLLDAGKFWVLVGDMGIVQITMADFSAGEAINGNFRPIGAVSGSDIWLGEGDDLSRWQITAGELIEAECYLDVPHTNAVVVDRYNNIWLATESSGLGKLSCLRQAITQMGKSKTAMLSLRPLTEQKILCTGIEDAFEIDFGNMTEVIDRPDLTDERIWDTHSTESGDQWLATERGLTVTHPRQVGAQTQKLVLPGPGRILERMGDYLIYGSVKGLYRIEPTTSIIDHVTEHGHSLGYVYTLLVDGSTCLVGTLGRGLWRYDPSTELTNQIYLGDGLVNVYCLDLDAKGRLLVGVDDQILIVESGTIRSVMETTTSVAAWAITWLDEHAFAMGSPNGLIIYSLVHHGIEMEISQFPYNVYWEFTTSRSLHKQGATDLLCALDHGVVHIDLFALQGLRFFPTIHWGEVECTESFERVGDAITLEEGAWRLSLVFETNAFLIDPGMRFSYQIVGLDVDWIPVEGNRVTITSLPIGDYQVNIRLDASFLISKHAQPTITIKVQPGSALRKGVSWLIQSTAKGFSELAHPYRNQLLKRRNEELEQTVSERTQELESQNTKLAYLNEELEALSTTDALTNLANRRLLESAMQRELARAARNSTSTSLLMIDVDHFKAFNDHYGHAAGDACLKKVADILKARGKRPTDIVARYGGEEFSIFLPETNLQAATNLGNEIIGQFKLAAIRHGYSDTSEHLTVSVGVAAVEGEQIRNVLLADVITDLINKADANLYLAKQSGRNRVYSEEA